MRYDIVADTHGHLSAELLEALRGADIIVHAGDMCSGGDLRRLERIAPVYMCLGNNDWGYDYGPQIKRLTRFSREGMRWEICHYEERLDLETCEIAICGHTHRPFVKRDPKTNTLVMNPGSPTFPRGGGGPTMGRIFVKNGEVLVAEIVRLNRR